MKPVAFRIQMYKGVLDSGWVDINPLTVIVGKNEAGKTTLLKALHKFKPFRDEPYSLNREWPRGHRREQKANMAVCTVRFRLSDDERRQVAEHTDNGLKSNFVEIARLYAGNFWVMDNAQFPSRPLLTVVEASFAELPPLPEGVGKRFAQAVETVTAKIRKLAEQGTPSTLPATVDQQKPDLVKSMEEASKAIEEPYISAYVAKLKEVVSTLSTKPSIRQKCTEILTKMIPTFIYMDDYRAFQGSILLDQLSQRQQNSQMTDEDRTVLMLMELSGLKLADVIAKSNPAMSDERQYDLSDAGRSLTNDIATRWTQRSYEVDFRADGQKFMTFVRDENDPSLIPLEDRSKGFQWFFSFDLMLMHETKGTFKDAVLLLDEPGLHLHPEAQKDLVSRLEKYAEGNTLIYSTHMPFMIDLHHPERIRVISETKDKGTLVHSDLTHSQKEAKFVLQAALGISGSQSYLLSQRNLIVEGVDDYWILTELSNLLRRSGELGLPEDVFITPAGGASEAAYIATFMIGQKLDVVVLLDSDGSGTEAHDKLVKTWLSCYQEIKAEVLMLGKVVEATAADFAIEDLFTDEYFVKVVQVAYQKELVLAGSPQLLPLPPGGLIWKRVSQALAAHNIAYGSGQKGRVAKALRNALLGATTIADLPVETQERARKLIEKIRSLFPSEMNPVVSPTIPKAATKARKPKSP